MPLRLYKRHYSLLLIWNTNRYQIDKLKGVLPHRHLQGLTREHGWRMFSANCLAGSVTARTSQDSCSEPGQRKTKSVTSSTN